MEGKDNRERNQKRFSNVVFQRTELADKKIEIED